jgi:DNA-binding transcriptional regulator YiaG
MPLAFRNVTAELSDPVSVWPTEAVQAALEGGDLEHWRRLAAEINRRPWGRGARQVEEVLSHSRPYGVADLMESVIGRARARADEEERRTVAAEVRQAIAGSGLTRAEFAARIGTSASRLSTYATGKVVPSATLMLRIKRLLADLSAAAGRSSSSAGAS